MSSVFSRRLVRHTRQANPASCCSIRSRDAGNSRISRPSSAVVPAAASADWLLVRPLRLTRYRGLAYENSVFPGFQPGAAPAPTQPPPNCHSTVFLSAAAGREAAGCRVPPDRLVVFVAIDAQRRGRRHGGKLAGNLARQHGGDLSAAVLAVRRHDSVAAEGSSLKRGAGPRARWERSIFSRSWLFTSDDRCDFDGAQIGTSARSR